MLTSFQKQKLTKLFSMYDAENMGVLKLSSFETIARRLGGLRGWKSGSQEELNLLEQYTYRWMRLKNNIKESTHHGSGSTINLEEWFVYHEILLEEDAFKQDIKALGNLIFDVIDLDENQKIDQQEWTTLFKIYGLPVVYSPMAFSQMDEDEDGFLTKEDILRRLQEFYWSQNPQEKGNYLFGPI
ncbi:hypothetical protein [Crocosphaera sp. XPORK-15E]|uniref:EF-hand domain-containing protein n=1 Tax=Crocosphaera sp. XPORK-15E TaxID=3110247 RepID=UPI002B1F925D|nr:hypothetical protein [Crocosphaera sp. XPORK-15E]MEA5536618.1 hypothetical protein [Crocosphaera sp. XPORK-15E]